MSIYLRILGIVFVTALTSANSNAQVKRFVESKQNFVKLQSGLSHYQLPTVDSTIADGTYLIFYDLDSSKLHFAFSVVNNQLSGSCLIFTPFGELITHIIYEKGSIILIADIYADKENNRIMLYDISYDPLK